MKIQRILFLMLAGLFCSTLTFAQFTQGTNSNDLVHQNGDVGIGTANPNIWFTSDRLLQVVGNRPVLSLNSTGSLGTISFTNSLVGTNHYGEFHLNHSYDAALASSSFLQFWTYPGGNLLTLMANGNVGVGNADPQAKLHVSGSTSVDGILRLFQPGSTAGEEVMLQLFNAPGSSGTTQYNVGSIVGKTNGTNSAGSYLQLRPIASSGSGWGEGLTVSSSDRVGIGTTTPEYKLHVSGDTYSSLGFKVGEPAQMGHDALFSGYRYSVNTGASYGMKIFRYLAHNTQNTGGIYGVHAVAGPSFTANAQNVYGIYTRAQTFSSGTAENAYSLFSESPTGSINNSFNIYASGGVKNYFGGDVGIGTTSPQSSLHINSANSQVMRFNRSGANEFGFEMGGTNIGLYDYTNLQYKWRTTNGNVLLAESSGHVGIGTINPDNKLHIEGDLLLDVFNNSGHEKGIFFREDFSTVNKYNVSILAYDHNSGGVTPDGLSINGYDGVSFSTGSNSRQERMRITRDGNMGIGTTSPHNKLHLKLENAPLGFDQALRVQTNHGNYTTGRGGGLIMQNADVITGGVFGIREQGSWHGALTFYTHTSSYGNTFGSTFTEKMRISHDGKVGIGTTNPDYQLEVLTTNRGEVGISVNDPLFDHLPRAYIGTTGNGAGFMEMRNGPNNTQVKITASGNSYFNTGYIGIGTTNPTERLEVAGNALIDGEVYSKRVKVSEDPGNWPDYVFESDYSLKPLSEVEAYIKANKHLPEVPSAKEVGEKGLDLGSMDATLLKKMEEMTLYMIEMEKKMAAMQKELDELKKKDK